MWELRTHNLAGLLTQGTRGRAWGPVGGGTEGRLQLWSWVMTHPAHCRHYYVAFFFFLNDRLKCFCPYQKSLFLRRIVSKNKKTNGFLNWLLKGYPVPCRYNCVTFVERKDKVNCCLVAEIKCLIITGLWLLVREIFLGSYIWTDSTL